MAGLLDDVLGWMQDPRRTQQLQGTGRAIQQGLLNIEEKDKKFQDLYDKAFGDPKNIAKVTDKKALSELTEMAMAGPLSFAPVGMTKGITKKDATVMRPQRLAYPEIYKNPKELVAEAAKRVAPEDPIMKQLFGVTRDDLWQMSQQGQRQGNITTRPFKAAASAKGAAHAGEVTNPRNTQRLQNIIGEAEQYPELYKGMGAWYTMDPLFKRFEQIYGPQQAIAEYNKFNALTGMASPGSEVLTEFNRGTAANWLANQGRFGDFQKFGGLAEFRRGKDFPPHLDEYRKLSLNYIVETGGNNVQTSFYDLERPKDDKEFKSKNIPYEDLIKTQKYVLLKNKWNLSNTQVCHSVENLDNLRIILFVVFDDNTDYETFTKDYTELLTEVPNLLTVFNSNKFI
jgi:hypothetical protein